MNPSDVQLAAKAFLDRCPWSSTQNDRKNTHIGEDVRLELVHNFHPLEHTLPQNNFCHPILLGSSEKGLLSETSNPNESSWLGSPMKLQNFDATQCMTSPKASPSDYKPLDMQHARNLIGLYNIVCQRAPELCKVPLWVLCNGQENIIALGTQADCRDDTTTITCTSVKSKYLGEGKDQALKNLPDVESLNMQRQKNRLTARYDIPGGAHLDEEETGLAGKSLLAVELTWDSVCGLLQFPPLDSHANLLVQVCSGSLASAAHDMFTELSTLKGLVQGLKGREVLWGNEASYKTDMLSLVKTFVQKESDLRIVAKAKDNQADMNFTDKKMVEREDLDFTELLWNVLKDGCSYNDLKFSLLHILCCIQSGKLQPMVHKQNRCQLAQLVRQSYAGSMTVPSLTGLQPLILLVEIGSEKLLRDYSSFFMEKDLVTAHDLENYLNDEPCPGTEGIDVNPHEPQVLIDVDTRLDNLEKLHQCLELTLLINNTFNLPSVMLGASARQVLRHYEKEKIIPDHIFHIPVQTSAVSSVLKRVGHVSRWQLHAVNKNGEESYYIITPQTLLPHIPHVHTGSSSEDAPQPLHLTTVEQVKISL